MIFTCIPARGDSKGLPGKNLRVVGGKTLLERAIEFALDLNYPVFVSTNSPDVATIANDYEDVTVVYAYPPLCHGDESRAIDVWKDCWTQAEKALGAILSESLYLEPSSPMREPEDAEKCLEKLSEGYPVCCTVEKVPLKYQYERQLVGFCDRACYLPKTFSSQPRQALSQTHIRNGAAYAATKQHIFERQALMSLLMATVITRRKINIDTEDDLNTYARWLEQQP